MYVTRAKIASILKIIERVQTLSASRTIFIVRANFNIIVKCETLNVEACYADEVVTRERRRGRQWSKWRKEASNGGIRNGGGCLPVVRQRRSKINYASKLS